MREMSESRTRSPTRGNTEYAHAILDTIPTFLAYVDRSCRYKAISKHYERSFGRSRADIVGREMREVVGEATWGQIEPAMRRALAGQVSLFEAEINLPHLGTQFSRGSFTPDIDEAGNVWGVVVFVQDITEEKRARLVLDEIEAYYRSVFNTPGVGHAETDLNSGRFLRVNQAMCDMIAYRAEELIGIKTVYDVTHPDDVERSEQLVASMIRGETDHSQQEKRYVRKDGTTIWASVSKTALTALNDAPARIFVTSQDITIRKRAEEMLQQSERNKDEFIATLAHELRNPLGAISNIVQLWRRSAPEPSKLEAIRDIIDRQVQQLKHLIDDLLDLTRISEGKIRLRLELFELNTAIQSAIESVRPLVEARGHDLSVEDSECTIKVKGDIGRITQVFTNLLNNAAKYTPEGGRITVRVNTIAPSTTQITIRDSGLGLAPEMLERIFEPFVQVKSAHDLSQGGLGIGLTLVRRIVELHHGSLVAKSEGLGKGSEFVVTLPTL